MGRLTRFILGSLAIVVVLIAIVAVSLPLFLNADNFRARIESTLSKSLGRKVTIGKLNLSVWSGGLTAQDAVVADDPKFSSAPFIQAQTVKIGVEIFPLLLHREIHIRGFSLESPKIQLLRASNGTWNYSTIGGGASAKPSQDAETKSTFPDLTVGHVSVENGQITVGSGPGVAGATVAPNRIYEQVNLDVKNFGFANAFPFTASAHLPGDGTVNINGNAGPINEQDASLTPFSGHLELKHIDPLAAGFVDASAGISGLLNSLTLDASWTGQQLHVTKLLVDTPHVTVVKANTPKQPRPANSNAEGTSMLDNLSVDDAEVTNGSATITTAGQAGTPAVYQQINAKITNLTPKSSSPFTASAQLPGGGSLSASGNMGPFNQENNAATPLDAQVSLKHVELESSGVLAPDAGISGMTDLQAQIKSNGQLLNAAGTAQVNGIKLARNGRPSAKPVNAQFAIAQDERALSGAIQHATITIGRAAINLAGTYQTAGPTTALNLKVNGQSMPIDELEAFLPALGVTLPQGSRLQGGTLTANLAVTGSSASPVISGPISVNGTQLAGFDLGAKLQSLSRLTGGRIGSATGSGTNIRSLSMNVREAGGGIETDKIALDVVGLGTATGGGTVSPAGALDYNVILKLTGLTGGGSAPAAAQGSQASSGGGIGGLAGGLSGLIPGGGAAKGLGSIGGLAGGAFKGGIPVAIRGTTSNPTFTPDAKGLITGIGSGAAQGLLGGKSAAPGKSNPAANPANSVKGALGGLLGKH